MAGLLTAPDLVAAELRIWASEPFAWASTDCGLSALAYVARATGRRLANPPRYRSRRGAMELLRAAGGYEAFARGAMAELGCPVTDAPERGDIGLAKLPGSGLTACLCLGRLWAARGGREAIVAPMAPVVAWSVGRHPCPRP